ncbi:MAG: NADH-quinone oxidoreductase subunit J [Deltaproteobacteria bacterium]|nr:NADH-quinone oxidoreductase subunit J [Deltaproteobacteria bacterium]MBM4316859.1 NADH-quinone oxidoreductase subunit J [Deltaproteobacteria bacterium]
MNKVLLLAEVLTVASAFIVAFHPNVLYASVFLLFTFCGVAAMFLFAGADFLAGAQVIIYVGGVTILILFAIMLTQWLYNIKLSDIRNKMLLPGVLAIAVGVFLYRALHQMVATLPPQTPEALEKFSSTPKTALIGQALLGSYLLPFEAITILLLGAMVGAVWLARPE